MGPPPMVEAGGFVVAEVEDVREPGMLGVLEELRLVEWERVGVRLEGWGAWVREVAFRLGRRGLLG